MGRRDEIVELAARLVDAEGPAALTMTRLAAELGIRTPSLYKHVGGLEEVEAAVHARFLAEWARGLEEVAGADDPVAAFGAAYRRFALARPGAYRFMTSRPLPRHLLPEGAEAAAEAPLVAALGTGHLPRAAWAFAHGMVDLELSGRFPPGADLGPAWDAGLEAFRRALRGKPGP